MLERQNAIAVGDDVAQRWEAARAVLRREAGDQNYRSWIAPVAFRGFSGGVLELSAPTRFMRDWVRTHYADRIRVVFGALRVEITVVAGEACSTTPQVVAADVANDPVPTPDSGLSAPLDQRCIFAHFVTGSANAMAAAAAAKLAASDEVLFNPLYIHGGVGLGKTHLLQATAAAVRARRPGAEIAYMTAERFMYRFVQALRNKDTMAFKAACRGIDMLLVDDIQFVCGKQATQEEFLSVLDALMTEGKSVVVAADRAPSDLDGIGDRLRSRLSGGLVAKVDVPDEALRLEILKSKRAVLQRVVGDDVLAFLAVHVTTSVRELEGALNRLIAHAELTGTAPTLAAAESLLADVLRAGERRITIEDIQNVVAAHYGLKMSDMLSPRRARAVARPRQVAMYLCKVLTPASLPDIGRKFGGRDHTTIIHGVRKIEELMTRDSALMRDVETLRHDIGG